MIHAFICTTLNTRRDIKITPEEVIEHLNKNILDNYGCILCKKLMSFSYK